MVEEICLIGTCILGEKNLIFSFTDFDMFEGKILVRRKERNKNRKRRADIS